MSQVSKLVSQQPRGRLAAEEETCKSQERARYQVDPEVAKPRQVQGGKNLKEKLLVRAQT